MTCTCTVLTYHNQDYISGQLDNDVLPPSDPPSPSTSEEDARLAREALLKEKTEHAHQQVEATRQAALKIKEQKRQATQQRLEELSKRTQLKRLHGGAEASGPIDDTLERLETPIMALINKQQPGSMADLPQLPTRSKRRQTAILTLPRSTATLASVRATPKRVKRSLDTQEDDQ